MEFNDLINSRTFCILPFVRQTLWYDGSFKLCCYAGGLEIDQAETNSQAFNTPQLKRIRESFLDNKFPNECSGCKNLVEQGITPPSYYETQGWITDKRKHRVLPLESTADILPQMLDIRYSNVCNLKCRTCNPYNSSAIQAEYNKIDIVDSKFVSGDIKQKHKHNFPNVDENLFRIYFAGGEPLVEQYNIDFLESWHDPDTDIIINTNLTVLTPYVIKLLEKFNRVTLNVSLDGTGAVNDYIRHGAKFTNVVNNLKTIEQYTNINVTICYVLNMYNVFNTLDFVTFVRDQFPYIAPYVSIQSVVGEPELFLECLPLELRAEAIRVLEQAILVSQQNSSVLNDTINILKADYFNKEGFDNFIKYARILDNLRNENLVDTVPQYKLYY